MKDGKILKATRTQKVDCWGCGIELTIQATTEDLNSVVEEIVLPEDVRLRVTVEGGTPVCFTCGERGYMKTWYTQRKPQTEQEERQESVDKATGKETEKEAEKGFTMAKKKRRRSGGMSSPPEKQKKKREEVRKETVKEGSRKEKKSKKKVELPVEKESETELYEGEMERVFMEEEKREPKVQEKGKKIRGGEGV
uniref:Uncharacterized protein n=1 Tax=Octopus bimaculoides TaxID=37653 RepID=A0A0L8H4Y9_OCTBM